MSQERIARRKSQLKQKRQPVQSRSRQRRQDILLATAGLLDRVGFDDLTTTLIARELQISVGALYHYFPHKQAILHAIGEHWLEEYSRALERIKALPLAGLTPTEFSEQAVAELLAVYREQQGLLPLVQAMSSVPELRDLDDHHDELVIKSLAAIFRQLGCSGSATEQQRRASLWLEMSHAVMLVILSQRPAAAQRSQQDLVRLSTSLIAG